MVGFVCVFAPGVGDNGNDLEEEGVLEYKGVLEDDCGSDQTLEDVEQTRTI